MTKSLNELRKKIKPEVQKAAREKAMNIVAEMTLAELRKARGLNQTDVAEALKIAQANISQLENRPDSLISTLSQFIEALGGKLEIHAKFPDGQDVEIKQFSHV
ncbi:MAG: helix-turn-helix domain-containing protein [Desulfobulbaceae bacterium]|nr:helix-turn-helix domain-containing protein [Desulfobulbaceae bacterium]